MKVKKGFLKFIFDMLGILYFLYLIVEKIVGMVMRILFI